MNTTELEILARIMDINEKLRALNKKLEDSLNKLKKENEGFNS